MKFEEGDSVVVKITNEEARVVEIINEKMVMIEMKGVRFPAYTDQLDFPYFNLFSKKPLVEKKTVYIDQVKTEKKPAASKKPDGVQLSFIPVYDKDIFDDDVVEKLKVYLLNQTDTAYQFKYQVIFNQGSDFEFSNTIEPFTNFYIHDISFEDLSDNPRFETEFSLVKPVKGKAPYFEAGLKLKARQLFKKIEEIQVKNEPSFAYKLFDVYPDKEEEEERIDLSSLNNAGFRVYDASKIKDHLPPPRSVVDLHIEKLTDHFIHLSNFEILTMQLNTFEKFYDLAVSHRQPSLIIIHGVGEGKLKSEIHEILKSKKEVASFINQYHALYGYGATEIFFKYP